MYFRSFIPVLLVAIGLLTHSSCDGRGFGGGGGGGGGGATYPQVALLVA